MNSPAPDGLEQDQARDESMPHCFCYGCLPPVGETGKAVCGTVARRRGTWGPLPGTCWVCEDLWDQGYTCRDCGTKNWFEAA